MRSLSDASPKHEWCESSLNNNIWNEKICRKLSNHTEWMEFILNVCFFFHFEDCFWLKTKITHLVSRKVVVVLIYRYNFFLCVFFYRRILVSKLSLTGANFKMFTLKLNEIQNYFNSRRIFISWTKNFWRIFTIWSTLRHRWEPPYGHMMTLICEFFLLHEIKCDP